MLLEICPNSQNIQQQSKCSYKLWLCIMCQCRLINYNKCTALVRMLIEGETMHVGAMGMWKISIHSAQYCWEPKTDLKIKNYPTLSLSHTVQKTVLYICVSFAVSHTGLGTRVHLWWIHVDVWQNCTIQYNIVNIYLYLQLYLQFVFTNTNTICIYNLYLQIQIQFVFTNTNTICIRNTNTICIYKYKYNLYLQFVFTNTNTNTICIYNCIYNTIL